MKKTGIMIFLMMLLSMVVVSANLGSDVRISMVNQDPDPAAPASYVDVRFKLENYGNQRMDDIYLKILPEYPLSLVGGEEEVKQIGGLQGLQYAAEGIIVKYRLAVDPDAIEGEAKVKVAYKEGEKGTWNEWGPFDVTIESSNKVISVDKYVTEPEKLMSGSQGKIKIYLANVADTDLKDVKAKLATGTDILPIGNTNEKHIGQIKKGATSMTSLDVIVAADTATGVYSIPLNITYSDFSGNTYTVINSISVLVDNKPELIVNLDNTDIVKAEQKGTVTIRISNSGISDIKFVTYKLLNSEDYIVLSTPFEYIGNIDSDDFDSVDSDIFVNDIEGDTVLNVEINYKDEFNKDYTISKELPLKKYTPEELMKYGLMPTQKSSSGVVFIAVGIILMIYWVFMLVDLVKKKMPRYKKILWLVIFIVGLPLGALIYQFFGKGRTAE